ncbi:BrnT family toxin [Limnohabitans sp.]|uniref:BrnT family toxin n=1 Tax=Limnohabitans sp. TaxID=1907725 RepID=UPI0038621769
MPIEFDPTKDASNQLKHGVSLAMAAELDWDAAWVWVDERVDYNEMRMIALAPKTEIL